MTKKKKELAVPRDLTIESFKKPEEPYVIANYRLTPAVIDEPSTRRIYTPTMHNDVFLAYLEFKMNKPWYERIFLP